MIAVTSFAGKSIALFGLGGSGLITASALMAGGADVVAYDDNPTSVERAASQGIQTGDLRQCDWNAFDALVLAPGVPLTHPQPHWTVELAHKSGVPVIGDIELFSRELAAHDRKAPLIAITGTNGKSTTTALIAHILKTAGRDVQMGGNIGRAVLDLDGFKGADAQQVYVVECSSYQIDLAPSLNPHVGILLNLTPDHLERHGTMENYAAIKERLVAASDLAVVGVDDSYCIDIAVHVAGSGIPLIKISSSQSPGADLWFNGTGISDEAGKALVDLAGIGSLRGAHNGQNAAAAVAACQAVGLDENQISEGLRSFPGLAHRMEQVGTVGQALFINDSKATNAEAAATALTSFEKVYWIAGGLAKDGGIASLEPHFKRVAKAYLVGEAAANFAATIGDTIPYEISGTVEEAVNHAAADTSRLEDAVVLLSPAAASFDQFPNFEKRGDAFKAAVKALDGFTAL